MTTPITQINARMCTSLHGNLPASFEELKDKIFYRETYSEFANEIWIPKSSITDATEDVKQLDCYKQLKAAFDDNPSFTDILLSNG
jgi:hypothetical protein